MLIQQALTQLKILQARHDSVITELRSYAAWPSKTNHPLGKVGTDDYDKKKAEEAISSLFQSALDIEAQILKIKVALQQTNLAINITIGDKTMTIAQALAIKDQKTGTSKLEGALIGACDYAVRLATSKVDDYNAKNKDAAKEDKKDVWYLYNQEQLAKIRENYLVFVQEVDAAIQIANSTNEVIGL